MMLQNLVIPHAVKPYLKYELQLCGITESYIYPDLEHLALEIKTMFS